MTFLLRVIISSAKITYSAESIWVKDGGMENASADKNTCIRRVYIRKVYTKGICFGNICFSRSAYIKGVNIGDICDSTHKPSKSFIGYSRLFIELISKMSINSCLHLQIILDKVIYCYSTYWIYSIVYLSF